MASLPRSCRLALAFLVLSALSLSSGAHDARATSSTPAVRRFALPAGIAGQPAIAGNTVAWVTRPGRCQVVAAPAICKLPSYLHLANLTHFHPRTIVRFAAAVSNVVVLLSPHWLVWMSTRYPLGGWWVWSRNLRTGRQTLVDSEQIEGGAAAPSSPNLSLRGDTLAWTRNDCGNVCVSVGHASVGLLDLDSGVRHVITIRHGACWDLTASTLGSHTLTWAENWMDDYNGCGRRHTLVVMRLDRDSGTIRPITVKLPGNTVAYDLTANDRYLAWTQETVHTDIDAHVMLMDTLTKRVIKVTAPGADRPLLNDGLLIWHGKYGSAIGALDLHTWRYSIIDRDKDAAGVSTGPGAFGLGSHHRMAWEHFSFRDVGGPWKYYLVVARAP